MQWQNTRKTKKWTSEILFFSFISPNPFAYYPLKELNSKRLK